MIKINDIDLKKWKEYNNIITDSLWIISERDSFGENRGDYHGNFIPQIPYQIYKRYLRRGEWLIDPFLGSGTSIIESKKLGINAVGVDISLDAINISKSRIVKTVGEGKNILINGDSSSLDFKSILLENKIESIQFAILHPPYWDIIQFNEINGNLALEDTLEGFLKKFSKVIDNCVNILDSNRYIAVIIGDIYKNSEWIPLHSYMINLLQEKKMILKSIVVKNMGETKAKQNQRALWRYRSLLGGFYVFSHEYILIFKKGK